MGAIDEYIRTIEERKAAAKASNKANRNKAKAYLQSTPNIKNLINAAKYYWLGNPHLGGENEDGADVGVAPTPGRGGGWRLGRASIKQSWRRTNGNTSTIQNIEAPETWLPRRLNPKSPSGKHATSRPQFGEELKEGSLGLQGLTPWEKASAYTGVGTPDQWKIGMAMGTTAAGVTASVPLLNKFTDEIVYNAISRNKQKSTSSTADKTKGSIPTKQTSTGKQSSGTPTKLVDKNSNTNNSKPEVTKQVDNTTISNASSSSTATSTSSTADKTKGSQTDKKNNVKPAKLSYRNNTSGNYKIQKGDTLYDIARRLTGNGNNYKELLKHNNIEDADKIYVGDTLNIPDSWRKKDIKKKTAFSLPSNLDEDYAQIQNRYSGKW